MAGKADVVITVDTTLDGSGNYTGDWYDADGVLTVRFANASSGARLQQSNDQTNLINVRTPVSTGTGYDMEDIPLVARYLRVVGFGAPSAALRVNVRIIETG